MTHSADLLSDVRLGDDKVRFDDHHLSDVAGYGTLTVVFPGYLTVELLHVVHAADIAFNLSFANGYARAGSKNCDRGERLVR